jgi:acetylglutamate kinase
MVFLRDSTFKGKFLSEAVSFIRKFSGETIIVKYGGSALGDINKIRSFAQDVVLLKSCGVDVVVVHGAGSHIDEILKKLGVKVKIVEGTPIATKENIDLIEMILSGHINKQIVHEICRAGGVALGFSGKDGAMITAQKMRKTKRETDSNIERIVDFGHLGLPHKVNTEIFEILNESPVIPVISPVGFDENGSTYTMNADDVAGAVASALNASRLILMTETGGIVGEDGNLISSLSRLEAEGLKKSKILKGAMLPKLEVCLNALKNGVFATHLVSVHEDHGILLELLTKDRIGTLIYNTESTFNFEDFEFDDCE